VRWGITLRQILQEVRRMRKTRNQLTLQRHLIHFLEHLVVEVVVNPSLLARLWRPLIVAAPTSPASSRGGSAIAGEE
jgi:hypothetical protein